MSGLRISVYGSSQLQAIILGLKGMDRDTRKHIRQETKAMAQPEWQQAVREHAATRLEQRVLGTTARVAVSDQNVTLKSAAIGRSLSGGLKPSESFGAVEFGGNPNAVRTYEATSSKGKRFKVTRHTQRQFRRRNSTGYVVYPAAADIIPRLAALWTQTVVRGFYDAIERR